jgi:hypothetical protein
MADISLTQASPFRAGRRSEVQLLEAGGRRKKLKYSQLIF